MNQLHIVQYSPGCIQLSLQFGSLKVTPFALFLSEFGKSSKSCAKSSHERHADFSGLPKPQKVMPNTRGSVDEIGREEPGFVCRPGIAFILPRTIPPLSESE